jgi:VCBS repeat-containing protein
MRLVWICEARARGSNTLALAVRLNAPSREGVADQPPVGKACVVAQVDAGRVEASDGTAHTLPVFPPGDLRLSGGNLRFEYPGKNTPSFGSMYAPGTVGAEQGQSSHFRKHAMSTTESQPIVFILDNVADYQSTADSLYAGYEVHVLSADGDALAQMVALLDGRTGLDAIHLISHGDAGVLDLGTLSLNADNLADHGAALAALGAALSPDGDFLLYGCDVAQGDAGVAFVNALADATGADVAASVDVTGPAALGGDAVLEYQTGTIEATTLAADAFQSALGVASVVVSQPTYDITEDNASSGWTLASGGQSGVLSLSAAVSVDSYNVGGTWFSDDGGNIIAVGQYGNLYLDPITGAYEYVPSVVAIDALGDGDTGTDTFTFGAVSADGDIDPGTFTFTVTGSNDAPVITLDGQGATIVEASGADNAVPGKEVAQINVLLSDAEGSVSVDMGAMASQGWTLSGDSLSLQMAGVYGSAQLVLATGAMTYTLDNNAEAVQLLNVGDQNIESFVVHVVDGQGLSVQASANFTIHGADDSAVMGMEQAVPPETYVDGNGQVQTNYSRTGLLSVSDVDTLLSAYDDLHFGLMGGQADDGGNIGVAGQAGWLYVNAYSGQFDYVGNAAVISQLAVGQTITETFTFNVSDAYGVLDTGVYQVEFVGVPQEI